MDKSTDNLDAGIDGNFAVYDAREHNSSMLGECVRQSRREFEPLEVVAICDHLRFLSRGQLKHKIIRKSILITFYLFVKAFCGYPVEFGEISVKHDAVATDGNNAPIYVFVHSASITNRGLKLS